jgi:hypothetical protein
LTLESGYIYLTNFFIICFKFELMIVITIVEYLSVQAREPSRLASLYRAEPHYRAREVTAGSARLVSSHSPVCFGLSGEPMAPAPTVGSAISGRRVAWANSNLVAPDCPVCTGQCPVRQGDRGLNGWLRQKSKEIEHRTRTIHVRWCTGLSGAPPDRRQELPTKWSSNGS